MRNISIFLILIVSFFSFIHAAQSQHKTIEYKDLIGRWVRPDGGYVLHFKAVNDDGSIDAEYLNPNPINVSMAKVSNRSDKIDIFVELRDIGYPGSFYTLVYEPDRDRLVGVYHHLVHKQNYDIYFVRAQ
jgi:hypothetical protein